jgi:hypothetical protein
LALDPLAARQTRLAAWLAFLIPLAVYLRTLMPTVGFWDTAEFQTIGPVLGTAHPTGYPLYSLLGKLFTLVSWGSPAYRMNLFSAVCAALAALGVVVLARRLGAGVMPSLAAALAFAFSLNLWRTANHADPHTLHVALVAGLWILALRWGETGDRRTLYALAMGVGLALGNHMLMVMEAPALALYVLWSRPRDLREGGAFWKAAACGLLGLGVYAYLPLRAMMHPALSYAHPTTWARFRYVVFAEQFRSDMGFLSIGGLLTAIARLPWVMSQYSEWFGVPGRIVFLALALGGWTWTLSRDRKLAVSLAVGTLLPFYAASTYVNADLSRYFLVPNLLLAALAAAGAENLLELLRERPGAPWRVVATGLAAGSLLYPSWLVRHHWPAADQHEWRDGERFERAMLADLKPRAVVFSWWSYSTSLWYGRYVEGRRPDVTIVDESDLVEQGVSEAAEAIAAAYPQRPVYLIPQPDQVASLGMQFRLKPLPYLIQFGQGVYEVVGRYQPFMPHQKSPQSSTSAPKRVEMMTTGPRR